MAFATSSRSQAAEVEWLKRVPVGFWSNKSNHKKYLEWLETKLGYKTKGDWYKISVEDFVHNSGWALLASHYNGSPSKMLKTVFYTHKWEVCKFFKLPNGYWPDHQNHTEFMDHLGDKSGYKSMDDWYNVTKEDFINHGGWHMLSQYYHHSPIKAVQSVFSFHNWQYFRFASLPPGFWGNSENQRSFMEYLGNKLGFKSMEDWYNISKKDFARHGGFLLLHRHYHNTLSNCVTKVFPERNWMDWLFRSHKGRANTPQYKSWLHQAMTECESKLNIVHTKHWHNVGLESIRRNFPCGHRLIKKASGLCSMLSQVYPHIQWLDSQFNQKGKKTIQFLLKSYIHKLFPDQDIKFNFRHYKLMLNGFKMELDIFIEPLNLAFEYNGAQHYMNTSYFGLCGKTKEKDTHKAKECCKLGITLIVIPYWWNYEIFSLQATIHQSRPDLISSPGQDILPIPSENPYPGYHTCK